MALAHRGGYSPDAPPAVENSLRAFRAAVALGYRYLETDVHVTSDGVLVAFHDEALDRVTDAVGAIADLPWSTVQQARIGGTEPLPLFGQLLEEFPNARFNVDLKASRAVEPLARLIDSHAAHDRVCVGSFSGATLAAFRRAVARPVALSASPVEIAVFGWLPVVRRLWPLKGDAFQMPTHEPRTGLPLLGRGMVRAAHARSAAVHVWTINDAATMHRLIDLGVDGIVADDIVTLKAVLVERALWEEDA